MTKKIKIIDKIKETADSARLEADKLPDPEEFVKINYRDKFIS